MKTTKLITTKPQDLDLVLSIASERIKHHNETIKDAQEEFADVIKGNKILLVNNTFNFVTSLLWNGLHKLNQAGYREVADLYINDLFHKKIPKTSYEMFQMYFGPKAEIIDFDVTKKSTRQLDNIAYVVFSGSSAMVTYGVTQPKEEVLIGGEKHPSRLTHGDVLLNALAIYDETVKRGIPVTGMCYGHQIVTHHKGGKVYRDGVNSRKFGLESVGLTKPGEELVKILTPELPFPKDGTVASYHEEATSLNPENSLLIVEANKRDKPIAHTSIHLENAKFSNDTKKNILTIKDVMDQGKHFALTMQGHPEYTAIGPLLPYAYTNDFNDFTVNTGKAITAYTLRFIAALLKQHKSFHV